MKILDRSGLVQAERDGDALHFGCLERKVAPEYFYALKGEGPRRMGARSERQRHPRFEAQEQREIIMLCIRPDRADCRQLGHLAEEPSRHVEQMDRGLVEIAAG